MTREILSKKTIAELLEKYPFLADFLEENNIEVAGQEEKTFIEYFDGFEIEEIEDKAIDIEGTLSNIVEYMLQMIEFLGIKEDDGIESVTIVQGQTKSGDRENFDKIEIKKGEIVSIVGPTGSGKSRLLADIEWTAQKDTPTDRSILINNEVPDKKWRYSSSNKLVAQLSQNMNFVMDLSVVEFLELHAKSRLVEDIEGVTNKIIKEANKLAGEKFDLNTPITSLSGGQSRALMIADTAILSSSPIILIDEIENAGIDRKKALDLLVNEDKIVLMATHDPILALMGDKRIIISNGGIADIIETSQEEKDALIKLEEMDKTIQQFRQDLRYGKTIKL